MSQPIVQGFALKPSTARVTTALIAAPIRHINVVKDSSAEYVSKVLDCKDTIALRSLPPIAKGTVGARDMTGLFTVDINWMHALPVR